MSDFEAQIRESQEQVAETRQRMVALTGQLEEIGSKAKAGDDIAVDIENATLEDVHAHTELMNANIAELIMGLDDVTSEFSKDFDQMRTKTGWESFVGMFSKGKSDSLREERMRSANIDDKLQDLIGKSDTIVALLQNQLGTLEDQKVKVEGNLTETLDDREATVGELETLRAEILGMDPKIIKLENKIIKLENKISVEQDGTTRTKLESDLAALNASYNEMLQQEQVKLAKSQTLERFFNSPAVTSLSPTLNSSNA